MATVTGTSKSRLYELKKFANSGTIAQRYFTSPNEFADGVNTSLTTEGSVWVYYIGGITYTDTIVNGVTTTTFTLESDGYNDSNNFSDFKYIKDESKTNVIDVPKVKNNININRNGYSIFENIYRLQSITTLDQFNRYAGGGVFNIVNNS